MTIRTFVKVHNIIVDINGINVNIPNGTIELPIVNNCGSCAELEVCRQLNQFITGTNLYNKLSRHDYKEFKSCGELGTNLSRIIYNKAYNERYLVFRSQKYSYKGRAKCGFEVSCELVG